jgi:CRISPR-associated protein Cmr3
MMQLFIEPIDVWLFRDGKPFDARSDHRAKSIFPPYPSVMQGVIRSQHLVVKEIDLGNAKAIVEAVGTATDFKKLNLRGPFLARWEGEQNARKLKRYFPVPADVAPQGDGYRTQKLKPRSRIKGVQISLPDDELPALLFPPDDSRETEQNNSSQKELGAWMDEGELQKCLRGDKAIAIETKDLFIRESRFGIGRNDATRTTEREYLYEAEFIRPCENVGLYVEVRGYDGWASSGVMRIGGEGRGASYEIIPAHALPSLKKDLPAKFKVYFATPTYFKNGWLPESWGKFFEVEPTLVAAAANRYESIGGFDWSNNSQKPARRYVPAGSVYYFEANGNVKLQDHVLETCAITDEGAQIGFGQIFITEVNHV